MTHDIEIRPLERGEWALLRALRLQALRLDPYAFASTTAREQAWSKSDWRAEISRHTWFVARTSSDLIGLVRGAVSEDAPDERDLSGLWVSPDWRLLGVARRLVEEAILWAEDDKARAVSLWVFTVNRDAIAFYTRIGFTPTGLVQDCRSAPGYEEMRMTRDVGETGAQ